MLLKIDGSVTLDNCPLVKDFKLNVLNNKHQLRCKFIRIIEEREVPVDIIVYRYSDPSFSRIGSITVDVDGREMNYDIPFTLKLIFSFIKKKTTITGMINGKHIKREFKDNESAAVIVEDLLATVTHKIS